MYNNNDNSKLTVANAINIDVININDNNEVNDNKVSRSKDNEIIICPIRTINGGLDIKFDNDLNIMYDESKIIYEGDQDNEYDGEYLYPSNFKTDVKIDKCLKECTHNSKCVGVEYNPNLQNFKNVCCLKSTFGQKKKRRLDAESGIFYIKKVSNFNDPNKNIIIV